MNSKGPDTFKPAHQAGCDPFATGSSAIYLVPLKIDPDASLDDVGFSVDQRFDLLAFLFQIGPGPVGATLAVVDIMFNLNRGMAWLRVEVLGPTGYAHVDVVLALESGARGSGKRAHMHDFLPVTLSSFASLADVYIDSISGPHVSHQQLCLLDPHGRPTW